MATIAWEDFERVDMRVGEIVEVEEFPEARKLSYRMQIDFGTLGVKKSSAAVKEWYAREDLRGRRVIAVVNFAPSRSPTSSPRCWSSVPSVRTGASSCCGPTTGPNPGTGSPRSAGRGERTAGPSAPCIRTWAE